MGEATFVLTLFARSQQSSGKRDAANSTWEAKSNFLSCQTRRRVTSITVISLTAPGSVQLYIMQSQG